MRKIFPFLIAGLVMLTGCNKTIVNNNSDSIEITATSQKEMASAPSVLTNLKPAVQAFRKTGGNWNSQVLNNNAYDLKGMTGDGYSYETSGYCADPDEGYTYIYGNASKFTHDALFSGEFTGKFISISGTFKGLNSSKLIWDDGKTGDVFHRSISQMSLKIFDRNYKGYDSGFLSFQSCLTADGDDYKFKFTMTDSVTAVRFIYFTFEIYYQDDVAAESFTLSDLSVVGLEE